MDFMHNLLFAYLERNLFYNLDKNLIINKVNKAKLAKKLLC